MGFLKEVGKVFLYLGFRTAILVAAAYGTVKYLESLVK